MITLLYRAASVGPVCNRLAKALDEPDLFEVRRDNAPIPRQKVLVRWGSRSDTAHGDIEINSAAAVRLAANKRESRRILGNLAPKTWIERAAIELPCVIRPRRHRAASKFFTCLTLEEARTARLRCGAGWYASELINKQTEYRIFILHGHVMCVSQRFPANPADIAWNLATGGKLINLKRADWPMDVCRAALEGAKLLGLDWTAIDAAKATDGKTYIFEANTAPGLRNKYTLNQIARAMAWVDSNPIPTPPEETTKWKHIIHPALH